MHSYDRRVAEDFENTPDEQPDDFGTATEFLNKNLEALPKHGWWQPPHNYVVNGSLMALNGWVFTILPFHAKLTAYRPAKDNSPEGIVIDPNWGSDDKDAPWSGKAAEIFTRYLKTRPSIPDTVRQELAAIERVFKIEIPSALQSTIIGDSIKVAKRRWGVDRLRRKKILMPFDGGRPIQLGSWD